VRILFDQGVPLPLRKSLHPIAVHTVAENGWSRLTNGNLIESAERDGYDILITTDQNLRYQQNLKHRSLAILVLKTTSWPRIRHSVEKVIAEVNTILPGGFVELEF
jgi:hypothetical protein